MKASIPIATRRLCTNYIQQTSTISICNIRMTALLQHTGVNFHSDVCVRVCVGGGGKVHVIFHG